MSKLFLVGLLAVAPAAAQRFQEATGTCAASGLCTIQTRHECNQAAAALSFGDTQARNRDLATKVAGCSTTKSGNLVFNTNLASTKVHGSGAGQKVFCQDCSQVTTTTAAPASCDLSNPYCEVSGACGMHQCAIQDAATCESAAQTLGLADTTANVITDSTKVSGCSTTKGGALRFNTDSNTDSHNADNDQSVICEYCPPCSDGSPYCMVNEQCDEVFSCTLTSAAECEAGASYTGHSDTTANTIDRTDKVRGCATTNSGILRFNRDMTSTAIQKPNNMALVICGACLG